MDRAVERRKVARRSFTISAEKLEAAIQSKDRTSIESHFNNLSEKHDVLSSIDNSIVELWLDVQCRDESQYERDLDGMETYRERWFHLQQKYREAVSDRAEYESAKSSSSCDGEKKNKHLLRLPKLELPSFDGNVRKWIGFWGLFKRIHDDVNLEDDIKYQYLSQAMEPGSPAKALVDSFPPSGTNYCKAVEQLKARYGRDDLLIEIYVRELLALVLEQSKGSNLPIGALYDKLKSQLHALETLGVTTDKYASMLRPLVESALPIDLLRVWERSNNNSKSQSDILNNLLEFIKVEVESEERIRISHKDSFQPNPSGSTSTSTAACLTNTSVNSKGANIANGAKACIFCERTSHASSECSTAVKMSFDERKEVIRKKRACVICLLPGHFAKRCRKFPKCVICTSRHFPLMCSTLQNKNTCNEDNKDDHQQSVMNQSLPPSSSKTVILQTIKLNVVQGNKSMTVRALLDSGAQRTFVTKDVITKLNMQPCGQALISHSLFGGVVSKREPHKSYQFKLRNIKGTYECDVEALEQATICSNYLPKLTQADLLYELEQKGVVLNDTSDDIHDISLLIGADYLGSIMTGRTTRVRQNLIAMETKFGWAVQGPLPGVYCAMTQNVTSLFTYDVEDLWKLETIGIRDHAEVCGQKKAEDEIYHFFKETIKVNDEGRYEVKLPFKDVSFDLPTNYNVALKRLESTTARLSHLGILEEYDKQFVEWKDSSIIEIVEDADSNTGHYLPHHAVVREDSSTTKIRPVFDASAVAYKGGLSLNACVEKGSNMIELIPPLLIKFRKNAIGIVSDIKKAFLQISLYPEDRNYLKFLWWRDVTEKKKEMITYRHKRVVFGVSTSPFLLMATIYHHLDKYTSEIAKILKESFYCDNCITSVEDIKCMQQFKEKSIEIMSQGQFELRCWVTGPEIIDEQTETTSVLGLNWDPVSDELYCKVPDIKEVPMSKRSLLSFAQSIFDPIGFTSPCTIVPKILVQKCWLMGMTWDGKLPPDIQKEINDWVQHIDRLNGCRMPRHLSDTSVSLNLNFSLHTFCDASLSAYSACVFLRSESNEGVSVRLVSAKSRVTPTKTITMPRLELIAAVLASRLIVQAKNALNLESCDEFYWTDSSIVLAWIQKKSELNVFVRNRIKITESTNAKNWRHVPGNLNPADLPSRGCNALILLNSRWWEGPSWLKESPSMWPHSEIMPDLAKVNKEIKNMTVQIVEPFSERLNYFSKYTKVVRMIGWCIRFSRNCLNRANDVSPIKGDLTGEEYEKAESKLITVLQSEAFGNVPSAKKTLNIEIFIGDDNILRVKTRLTLRDDVDAFISPILLPGSHLIVQKLVRQRHVERCHAGSQMLINDTRQEFWITGIRRLVKKIIRQCVVCRRYNARCCTAPPAPLPVDRTLCGAAFDVTGIDFAGPLFLRTNEKCWIALFTCATYRALHLELCKSLSTEEFMLALRRFIARRGRPRVIYSDNGTNFQGTNNLLRTINWDEVSKMTSSQKIKWRFIPPLAPWWGGFWERMVKLVKEMLRKIIGKASLCENMLTTLLCEVEGILNNRPLTYIADSTENLAPLTPALFLHDIKDYGTPDLDRVDGQALNTRLRHMQKLREDFKARFRNEYLSLLIQKASCKGSSVKPGDIVLVEAQDLKRVNWPLAIILEVYPGPDGQNRVARIKTANGERIRAVQRLFPLEIDQPMLATPTLDDDPLLKDGKSTDDDSPLKEMNSIDEENDFKQPLLRHTRSGRLLKVPERLNL